ncbi:hypothetical protein LY76DRAFT_610725 [Colletotrichum caudatum]|nr:hypothetical protein LY76DRAFT_610725 [Colletotrichum caudatum]
MPSPVDASPRLPSFMSATRASSSRATNTANDPAAARNAASGSAAASNNTASNVPDLSSATATTVATTAAAQDPQTGRASATKVTASQRARQYLRWAKAHPYPATDMKDGNKTAAAADDDEERKTVYALIRQIDPSGDKLQSLASLCEEEASEPKWPPSWDQGKLGYLKGMIKKDLVRWVRQLAPVEGEEDEEEASVAEELAKRVDGLSVGAEVHGVVQGGLGQQQLESQPVGAAAQVTGVEGGGALFGSVEVQALPPRALTSVPSSSAARSVQANPPQQPTITITRDAFLGVGAQSLPPPAPATVVPSPAPVLVPVPQQQSVAPVPAVQPSPGPALAPALAARPVT